ncbi:Mus7/MMS22 family-domain-containing protein [Cytidiella melzeri]|nr:Mus7/MMS22 family-domain-containing protein [Cytidiella melzeri]
MRAVHPRCLPSQPTSHQILLMFPLRTLPLSPRLAVDICPTPKVHGSPNQVLESASPAQASSSTKEEANRSTSPSDNPQVPVSETLATPHRYSRQPHMSPQSRELSADPLLLFTPSTRLNVLPAADQSPSSSSFLSKRNRQQTTPTLSQRQPSSSPLTPVHSREASPRSPLPANFPPYTTGASLSQEEQFRISSSHRHDQASLVQQLQEQEPGRYSLRTREPRQLKPFLYEKRQYKNQMRNIPEALVSQRSPHRRHRRGASTSAQDPTPSSDPDVDPNVLETEDSDCVRRRRRRSASGRPQEILDPPSVRSNPENGQRESRWMPAALKRSFSSSDDDINRPSGLKQPIVKLREDKVRKRKKRIRQFPMPDENLSKPFFMSDRRGSPSVMFRRSASAKGPAESSDDEQDAISRPPTRMSPLNEHGRFMQDVIELHDVDLQSASGPPTSSSLGRLSDAADNLRHISLSPAPISPHPPRTFQPPGSTRPLEHQADVSLDPYPVQLGDDLTDDSDPETGSEEPSDKLAAKERRQYNALKRMWPMAMLHQQLGRPSRSRHTHRHKAAGGPSVVGRVRTRVGAGARTDVEIKGDSESSDSEPDSSSSTGEQHVASLGKRTWDIRSSRPRGSSVISILSSDELLEDEPSVHEEVDDEEVNRWMSHPAKWQKSTMKQEHERNLVDYMLAGTRVSTNKPSGRPNQRSKHRERRTYRPILAGAGISVTTQGTRKHGTRRQTRIPDHMRLSRERPVSREQAAGSRRGRTTSPHPAAVQAIEPRDAFRILRDAATLEKAKDRKRKKARIGLHTFHGNARVDSGRRYANGVTVDEEDELYGARSSKSIPGYRRKEESPKHKQAAAPWTSSPDIEGAMSEDYAPPPEVPIFPPEVPSIQRHRISRRFDVDAGVSLLPLGIAFSFETWLGKGHLKELLHTRSNVMPEHPPPLFYIDGTVISHAQPIPEFTAKATEDDYRYWARFSRSICPFTTWFASHATDEERLLLIGTVRQFLKTVPLLAMSTAISRPDANFSHKLALEVRWTAIELAFRMQVDCLSVEDAKHIVDHIKSLVEQLWLCGLEATFRSVTQAQSILDYSDDDVRLGEIWICLIQVSKAWDRDNVKVSFGDCLADVVRKCLGAKSQQDGYDTSEHMWQTLYMICALSQFSVYGTTTLTPSLAASWKFVTIALESAPLMKETISPQRRDKYITLLMNRCVRLHQQWRWPLENAQPMFLHVCKVFQSRRYGNLLHEEPEFPDFLCQLDLHLLYTHNSNDTAFTTLLKLIVQAAGPPSIWAQPSLGQPPASTTKLLAVLVPVGSVQFAKGVPATARESSMLTNRFTAVAIALMLSPTTSKARFLQARHYADVEKMDMQTRRTCIRGFMYLTCILRHLQLPLNEATDWLKTMRDSFLKEFCSVSASVARDASIQQDRSALCVQMLLGSVRYIIETPSMVRQATSPKYPEPSLLDCCWAASASATKLLTISATRQELIRLVWAFLDKRSAVILQPQRTQIRQQIVEDESQESYGDMDQFDYDDPELASALGEHTGNPGGLKASESDACSVFKSNIWAAVNNCVYADLQQLKDATGDFDTHFTSAVTSIECWVRSASVMVKNDSQQRPWSWFFHVEIEMPIKDLKRPVRSKIELYFKLAVVKWDPSAYNAYQEIFFQYFFYALSTYQVTFEHEYASLIMTLGGLKHPLLAGLSYDLTPDGDIRFTKAEFLNAREDIIGHILTNFDRSLSRASIEDFALQVQNQTYLNFISTMFVIMQETAENLQSSEKDEYTVFCRSIAAKLMQCQTIMHHAQSRSALSWLITITANP